MSDYVEVTSEEELRALMGNPMPRAAAKERKQLHEMDRRWLAASPFIVVGTSSNSGACNVSPKGDPRGFVHVIDDTTIAIPDRPGNKRYDAWRDVLANPHVGLLFLIPGRSETLRINGRARLVRDAPFFDEMIIKGHRPQLALVVEIETIFFHCGKAFLRSKLWQPDEWGGTDLPSHACIVNAVQPTGETIEELEAYYSPENYNPKLYKAW